MYQLLLYVHILTAVTWVGGAFFVQVLALRVMRSDEPAEVPRLARHVAAIGTWVFMPAAVLLLLSGAAMTLQAPAWSFGQAWIAIAIALWLLSALAGALYLGPRAKQAARHFDADGPESPAGLALTRRLFLVSRIELLSFAIVIALMVFKPGV